MNNRTRLHTVVAIPVLLMLLLTLAACEKDRAIQTPKSSTPRPQSGQALTPAPGQAATPRATSAAITTSSPSSLASPIPSGAPGTAAAKPTASTVTAGRSATQVAGQGIVYTVQLGDTLGSIAKEFGVTMDAIIRSNSLTNPDVLMVGQELRIPAQQATSAEGGPGQAGERAYVVIAGDTLGSIARRFGVPLAELQALNNIDDPDQITVGQELRIPASASGGTATQPSDQEKTYVVEQGDTLFKIALRFGVTVAALQSANNIDDPDKVYPGQVLTIP